MKETVSAEDMAKAKAGTEGLPRQAKWKVIRYRLGQCINCGNDRGPSPFRRICSPCGLSSTARKRKKLGRKAWKPGSPGRPPLRAKKPSPEALSQNDTREAL